jgi:predicted RNase H-like nuclease
VFPAPTRAGLEALPGGYRAASAANREASGRALSKQTFHLLAKIGEVDAAVAPAAQGRVVEAHPELAFTRLGGRPPRHPKRTTEGRRERMALLEGHVRGVGRLVDDRPRGCAADDVLDAAVLAITARRLAEGRAERLGDGARDRRGLRMEIAW